MDSSGLIYRDISDEEWREYDFCGYDARDPRVYRIESPKTLVFRHGGSTHRVVDAEDTVHLVPGPGYRGCVIRWKTREGVDPVAF
jgi:hypothetical protein